MRPRLVATSITAQFARCLVLKLEATVWQSRASGKNENIPVKVLFNSYLMKCSSQRGVSLKRAPNFTRLIRLSNVLHNHRWHCFILIHLRGDWCWLRLGQSHRDFYSLSNGSSLEKVRRNLEGGEERERGGEEEEAKRAELRKRKYSHLLIFSNFIWHKSSIAISL